MIDLQTGQLKYKVIQSPMAACTDLPYRLLSRKKGMDYCFLEMVSANGMMHDSKQTQILLQSIPEDSPVGAQLVGCEPDVMAAAAEKMEELGFDSLDLNLGCPVRKVTSQGAGAALLKAPREAEKVFKAVVKAVKKIPVTVKIRKGFEDDSGDEAVEIAKTAEGSGIKAVTMHGRTRAQGYTGKADWPAIGKVKKAVKIPVIGNGDVLSVEDAKKLIDISGCDGIMIGRGGLGNPWLFKEIRAALFTKEEYAPPTVQEKIETVLEHMALEAKYLGVQKAIFHMRRIGSWYIQGIRNAAALRGQLNQAKSLEEIGLLLKNGFLAAFPQHE